MQLTFMTSQDSVTSSRHGVVDAGMPISTSSHQLAACRVESDVEDLVIVTSKGVHALTGGHIPYPVELRGGEQRRRRFEGS